MFWNSTRTSKWAVTSSLCTGGYNVSSCYIRHYDEHHKSLRFVHRIFSSFLRFLTNRKAVSLNNVNHFRFGDEDTVFFRPVRKNFENRLLASSCLSLCLSVRPSVRPSVCFSACNNTAPTGRIFMKFGFSKICRENSSFVSTSRELLVLCMKTNIHFW